MTSFQQKIFEFSSGISSSEMVGPFLDRELAAIEKQVSSGFIPASKAGKLGPELVAIDVEISQFGLSVIAPDRLEVVGNSNFSTVLANCCVYKGKWMYEVCLGSKGIMQLGWCTRQCRFSTSEGVGDTPTSYSYDGNRQRKWNVQSVHYGEPWLAGDVITCAIDCDQGQVIFFRNGQTMGIAFDSIPIGETIAYVPAISLSQSEIVRVNFGSRPFFYPIDGFRPFHDPPLVAVAKADKLLTYFGNLVQVIKSHPQKRQSAEFYLTGAGLFDRLAPLLQNHYVVEKCFLPRLKAFDHDTIQSDFLLDVLWNLMETSELVDVFGYLLVTLLTHYRFCIIDEEYLHSIQCLEVLFVLLHHEKTRKLLMRHVLFDKIQFQFAIFFHIKSPDDEGMAKLFPVVVWPIYSQQSEQQDQQQRRVDNDDHTYHQHRHLDNNNHHHQQQQQQQQHPMNSVEKLAIYRKEVLKLKEKIDKLELLQIRILLLMLKEEREERREKSSMMTRTTRTRMDRHLRQYGNVDHDHDGDDGDEYRFKNIKITDDNATTIAALTAMSGDDDDDDDDDGDDGDDDEGGDTSSDNGNQYGKWRTSSRSIFLQKFRNQMKELIVQRSPFNALAPSVLAALLHRICAAWRILAAKEGIQEDEYFLPIHRFFDDTVDHFNLARLGGVGSHLRKTCADEIRLKLASQREEAALRHPRLRGRRSALLAADVLFDSMVLLYSAGGHRHLTKVKNVREATEELCVALRETDAKLKECPPHASDIREALMQSRRVFLEKLDDQARQMGWVQAVVFSEERHKDVVWLLQSVLRTMQRAHLETNLFGFVPVFYIDVCLDAFTAVRNYFPPLVPFDSIPDGNQLQGAMASLLARHFTDERILDHDVRDSLLASLATFVSHRATLDAMERLPIDERMSFIGRLIQPYEGRNWAQMNWILIRLWKGCGFGFRYLHLPYLLPSRKDRFGNFDFANHQFLSPSHLLQRDLGLFMSQQSALASAFINSVLNHANWAFSQFVETLQEFDTAMTRAGVFTFEPRQMKICATCFDLTVSLLRTLEMCCEVYKELLLDETTLRRMSQFIAAILNRVTSDLFTRMLSFRLPGMDTVDAFPALVAAAALLIQMVLLNPRRENAIQTLIEESGFQLSTVELMLEPPENRFYLLKYNEISSEEMEQLKQLVQVLKTSSLRPKASSISEDEFCPICFADAANCQFSPCGHHSCRSCIERHLLNSKLCFFCKKTVQSVHDVA